MHARGGLVWAVLLSACSDPGAGIGALTLETPLPAPRLLREAKGEDAGGADLLFPTRPTPVNGDVWILDVGNDRLVRFDSALATATTFGREGRGPGEIQFALELIAAGDRLLVGEVGNARISVFDTTGAFRGTVPWRRGPEPLDVMGEEVITAGPTERHYAQLMAGDGTLRPWAEIPAALRRLAASDPARYPPAAPWVAVTPGGRLYVVDTSVLALAVFAPDGTPVGARLLPEPFRTRLLDYRTSVDGALAASPFLSSPGTKRVSLDGDGGLLVLFPLPDHWGLLIDPGRWSARPLPLPLEAPDRDLLWSASDARRHDDRLFVTGEGLHEFRLEGWP